MPTPSIINGEAWEASGPTLMARVTGADAAAITQASLSSITLSMYATSDLTTAIIDERDITISSTVFDTLQTDSKWTKDSTGYNFAYTLSAADLPEGDVTYRFEFIFNPASGEDFPVVFEIDSKALASV